MSASSGIRTHDSSARVTEDIAPTCWPRCVPGERAVLTNSRNTESDK